MKISAFNKRIKRRIIGREHPFFAVCTPGLTRVCFNEMIAHGLLKKDIKIVKGGIEFQGRIKDSCLSLNLNLKSPLRILMRISNFKADSFEKLENKFEAIDWILYLPQNCFLKFNVTSKKSRLYHSDAIAQRCEKIIIDQLQANSGFTANKKSSQTIYIRAENNNFTISIDTTGDLLFKRGIKKKVAQAPLRENIAFAMLWWAGFSSKDILLDPMCGSGTFSLEAAMMQSNIPSGFFRSFAFEQWPGASPRTFSHMKKKAKNQFIKLAGKHIFASDIDETALAAFEQNRSNHDFSKIIDISKKDFFDISPSQMSIAQKGVIMLNPPYGKRLGQKQDTSVFYREIGRKLKSDFRGWRVSIVLPSRKSKSTLGLKLELKPIFHGGLDIFAGIGKII